MTQAERELLLMVAKKIRYRAAFDPIDEDEYGDLDRAIKAVERQEPVQTNLSL